MSGGAPDEGHGDRHRDAYDVAHETALVGTARADPLRLQAAADALLGPGLAAGARPEARLLELAAAAARVRRATVRPVEAGRPPLEPAPPSRRGIGTSSASALEAALSGPPEVQAEALGWVAHLGLVLDADTTVRVLELATARPALRPVAVAATGPRGRWLGALNGAWSWVGALAPQDRPEERWEHAPLPERQALLHQLRRHDPARGRRLLASTLATERADALAALLAELAEGLGADDEALLEQCLDDRRVPARRAAAAVLERLPGSALAERAGARARRRLAVQDGVLLVHPRDEGRDAEVVRDAVPLDRLPGLGEQASLLAHDLARVPPRRLQQLLAVDAAQLVVLARASDWWPSLRHALVQGARRERDREVLLALLPHVGLAALLGDGADDGPDDALVAALVAAELALPCPREARGERDRRVLLAVPGPWGAATAQVLWPALLAVLDTVARDDSRLRRHDLQELARAVGLALPVGEHPLTLDPAGWSDDGARSAVETVLSTHARRQRVHRALLDDAARLEAP